MNWKFIFQSYSAELFSILKTALDVTFFSIYITHTSIPLQRLLVIVTYVKITLLQTYSDVVPWISLDSYYDSELLSCFSPLFIGVPGFSVLFFWSNVF